MLRQRALQRALQQAVQLQQTTTALPLLLLHQAAAHSTVAATQPQPQQHPTASLEQPVRQQTDPQPPQHATPGGSQHYAAAAALQQAAQPQWAQQQHWATPQHQQRQRQPPDTRQHAVLSSAAAAEAAAALAPGSSSSSGGGDDDHGGSSSSAEMSVFTLSSPHEEYQRTVASLRLGRAKNMDQLAHMFDPQAVLAAPDRGAAVLEGLMAAAAKLQDLQLLRQLLRCTAAAGNPLSSAGHCAVLHCLASCGRFADALEWLQIRVPEQQLTPHLLRQLVQPLLQQRQVQAAQQALDYAEPKLQQRWQAQLQQQAAGSSSAKQQQQSWPHDAPPPLRWEDLQDVPCLRLGLAAATGRLSAVQQQWAAITQQAQETAQQLQALEQQQQQQAGSDDAGQLQQLQQQQGLTVELLAAYVLALQQVAKRSRDDRQHINELLWGALLQLLDRYQATAWERFMQQRAARISRQQQDGGVSSSVGSAQEARIEMQWLRQQQQSAQQLWQQHRQGIAARSWQELDSAAVMPQEVSLALRKHQRKMCRQALHAGLALASGAHSEQQMQQLLKLGSLLNMMPQQDSFRTLLLFKANNEGAPPEALEELLGEMMAWGVTPTVAAYEHVLEAHALHRDLGAAEAVLDRMEAAGLRPVLSTYNRLLHGVAINGSLAAAIRVYSRMRLQGLQPDIQTLRSLFKCVRLYASNVRVATARTIALTKPGDRLTTFSLLSQRAALFASAYSQLTQWQRDMGAAGLKHNGASITNLTAALERLGAVEDCLQLARLAEGARPGEYAAHRAALKVAGRSRDVRTIGEASKLAAQLAETEQGLSRDGYMAVISSQFWLSQDHQQLLRTVAEMKAAGHELNEHVLQQLLHVYCHTGMWGEALQVLTDAAAGRFDPSSSSSSSRQQASSSSRSFSAASNDKLWHVVMRKLWECRASDELLNEFLAHMAPAQRQRFKLLYGLHPVPGQRGRLTLTALEDWQLPLQQLPSQLLKEKTEELDGAGLDNEEEDAAQLEQQQQLQDHHQQDHYQQQHQQHQQEPPLSLAGVGAAW